MIWGKIADWSGGFRNKIEGDKAHEICNFTSNKKVLHKQKCYFVSGMVRAGEKIKYCGLGHLVGHIYFTSSIETLNKEGQKCGRKLSERLEPCQGIFTIKEKNIMILVYKLPQHKISNSVFCECSITCVTCEPRKLPVLASKYLGSWKTQFTTTTHQCQDCLHYVLLRREIALDFSTIYPFNVTQNHSDSENFIFMTHSFTFMFVKKL